MISLFNKLILCTSIALSTGLAIAMEEAPHRITVENRRTGFIYAGPVNNFDKHYLPIACKDKAVFYITPQKGMAYMQITLTNYEPSNILLRINKKVDHITVRDLHHIIIHSNDQLVATQLVKKASKL